MRVLPVLVALGALVFLSQAHAQRYAGPGWGGGYHASTAQEGRQRGFADIVRSKGMANLMNSEASKNYEQARSAAIDNRSKWTKTYFEMRRYNKEYRDAERGPRPTSEQLFRLAKDATPKRLAPTEVDPVTGKINWPELLQKDDFADNREAIDTLYAARAQAGGKLTLDQFKEVRSNIKDLQILLARQVKDLPPQVFTQANAFTKRLEYEAQMAM